MGKHKEFHGKSYTKLYGVWHGMIQRVTCVHHKAYKNYGGRGITVCKEWESPTNFINWALANGYKEGLTIERKNNNGNYCPDNCIFTTHAINNLNKRYKKNAGISYDITRNDYKISLLRYGKIYYNGRAKTYELALIKRDELLIKIDEK